MRVVLSAEGAGGVRMLIAAIRRPAVEEGGKLCPDKASRGLFSDGVDKSI